MNKVLFSLLACLMTLTCIFAQKADTIPFVLTPANNISIQAILNERDTVDLMLHTAASGMTLTKEATTKLNSLDFSHKDTVNSWGGDNASRYSMGNRLQIGRQSWEDLQIWENENSGRGTDGKFGLSFFKDQVVVINFDRSFLVLSDELPEDAGAYPKVPVRFDGSFMFFEGELTVRDSVASNQFLIHSGYGGSLLLDDEFVQQHRLGDALEIIKTSILKDSYGNELKTQKAILPFFQLGDMAFQNIPVGFFEGSIGRQKMSVIGGDLLKRFNIIFDLKDHAVYLSKSRLVGVAFKE